MSQQTDSHMSMKIVKMLFIKYYAKITVCDVILKDRSGWLTSGKSNKNLRETKKPKHVCHSTNTIERGSNQRYSILERSIIILQ